MRIILNHRSYEKREGHSGTKREDDAEREQQKQVQDEGVRTMIRRSQCAVPSAPTRLEGTVLHHIIATLKKYASHKENNDCSAAHTQDYVSGWARVHMTTQHFCVLCLRARTVCA